MEVFNGIQGKLARINEIAEKCRRYYSMFQVAATATGQNGKPNDKTRFELESRGVIGDVAAAPITYLFRPPTGGRRPPTGKPAPGDVPTEDNSAIYDACSISETMLDYKDVALPPLYPFAVDYFVDRKVDADGKDVLNLVAFATGSRIARVSFVDSKGMVLQIFNAVPQGSAKKAGGSSDITGFREGGRLPIRVRVEVQSGREYELNIPYL